MLEVGETRVASDKPPHVLAKATVEIVGPDDPDYGEWLTCAINEIGCGEAAAEQAARDRVVANAVCDLLSNNPDVFTDGRQFRVRVHRTCGHGEGPCPSGTPSGEELAQAYAEHPIRATAPTPSFRDTTLTPARWQQLHDREP